ncbi:conserved hypothetical protein [Neospora caninum Liverpool]|uniref:VPS9 domain-containing protein n=1 Tax=Neospora caninum (strain Liverpool) TaxID=572307 RepID=F0VFR9_NEOCL|nr:conserved hypothetical protein [Neospora caninum Liverpool]CBZ52563.1 conserved hypothetical protein [Neospora caninum Liverpool]CEL66538.1 TPA: hypothetical protein BN1204_023510 [Neospora caninum Liverpool]|eukprot:XP_003882595.1 conserved hypothetical protein [Neospora caninum Liverpool]
MSLGTHAFLQQVLRLHERLLMAAASSASLPSSHGKTGGEKNGSSSSDGGSVLVLLPVEESLRGLGVAEQLLVETHLFMPTSFPSQFINLRGQGVHRENGVLISDFGFPTPLRLDILAEEIIYDRGLILECVLVSSSLFSASSSSSSSVDFPVHVSERRKGTGLSRGLGEEQEKEEKENLEKIEAELRAQTMRWWRGSRAGAAAEKDVEEEIRFFKDTYILALGCDTEIASRLRELVSRCTRRVSLLSPSAPGGPGTGGVGGTRAGSARFLGSGSAANRDRTESDTAVAGAVEGFVFLCIEDYLWSFAIRALAKRQEKLEVKLKELRNNLPFLHERLQVKRILRGVPLQAAAAILDQLSSWRLPEQKTACLAWAVRSIQGSCRTHVRRLQGRQQRRAEMERKETRAVSPPTPQPVEITVDDLVGLLLVAAALSQGRFLLANLWLMNLFNLQRPREAQFDETSFHLTTLQSALSFAFVVSVPPQTQGVPQCGDTEE